VRAVEIGMHVVQQQCPTSVGHTARQCSNPRHCRGKKIRCRSVRTQHDRMCAQSRRRCAPSPGADVRPVPAQMCAQVPAQMWPRPGADVAQSRHAALVSPGESMRPSSVAARTVTAARRRDSVEAEPLDISVSLTSRWPLRPCRCATAQTDRSHRGRRCAALRSVQYLESGGIASRQCQYLRRER
jgi:hypothetical protein